MKRSLVAIAAFVVLCGGEGLAHADGLGLCEGFDELDEEEQADVEQQVRRGSVIGMYSLLNGGGVAVDNGEIEGSYHLELSAGVTYATRRNIHVICEREILPSAIGWEFFLGTHSFRQGKYLAGAMLRYSNQLRVDALVPVWELGGGTRLDNGTFDPLLRVGLGLGNPNTQFVLLGDVIFESDDSIETVITLNLRIHLSTLAALRYLF